MKPLGKAMKMAIDSSNSLQTALTHLLNNYRDTPHPATGLPPSAMLFRDPPNSVFPRVAVSDKQIQVARKQDVESKLERQVDVNSSKYKKRSEVGTGDWVLIRNFNKKSKFDPLFQPKPCMVKQSENGWVVLERDGSSYRRHLDDIKPLQYQPPQKNATDIAADTDTEWQWKIPEQDEDESYGFLLPDNIQQRDQREDQQAESLPPAETVSSETVSSEMDMVSDLHHPEQQQQQVRRPGRPPGTTKRRGFRGNTSRQGHAK